MDTLLNLRAFLAAARHGSFSEASRQINVVPSVVAKRVNELEHTIQSQLFVRSTRQLVLTDAGHKFLTSATSLVAEFDAVVGSMKRRDGGLEGHIRVKMPTTLTVLYLANIVSTFQSKNERITMEVVLVDRTINPVEEGYDVVVTGLSESYEGVTDLPLCPLKRIVCASPDYLRNRRVPEHPRDLADHDCLVFRPKGPSWQFDSPAGPISVDVPQKLVTNDNYILFSSACAGNGIAVLPEYLARDSINEGALQVVLSDFPLRATWLKALVPKRRERLPHVIAFTDWLKLHLTDSAPWDPAAHGDVPVSAVVASD
ncbi:LysR family transcriptional regulator [Paraburkholderia diazotrophica]|uniref:DNA-binding transcriptional regulator, LysR family n=1 Tax=Paraburkholderia diazotrophica TaxID=667676 RepID=A0A1H7D190_9BURK|nr:LysR family transcriptional regulator [Paraburkholderia diazotrophica]SEJ91875.1 DNA-binding transcriptional regulator, LysR family [Paraburkholderia diazotrophica]